MTALEKKLSIALAICAVLLAVGLIQMITPSTEAVRVRNALIFDVVDIQEINWTPSRYPLSFKLDDSSPPDIFQEAASHLAQSSSSSTEDFDAALAIGRHLAVGEVKGGAIQSDTVSTFTTIMSHGTGYCADFTQVFNGLAHAMALPVREWGMSFDGFGGDGHAFNEVFDRHRDQWVFIDTFYSFYVIDRNTDLPLSALQFRHRLKDQSAWSSIQVIPISDVRFAFDSEEKALEYYLRGVDEFYLWWGNNVFQYDDSPLVKLASKISRSAEQAVAILIGVHPEIRIPSVRENDESIANLKMVRAKVLTIIFLEFLVVVTFLAGLVRYILRSRSRSSSH